MSKNILLTFDVEDWFHSNIFNGHLTQDLISNKRAEIGLEKVLSILKDFNIQATFFVLGELVKSNPIIIEKILNSNPKHEIASHSFFHTLLYEQSKQKIIDDICKSKMILEKYAGNKVIGFRAPYFSVNDYVIKTLVREGFKYDSSLHDFKLNPQYGSLKLRLNATKSPGIFTYKNSFFELTIPVKRYLKKLVLPFGGGGYFRIYPYILQKYWINSFLKNSNYFLMYMHPWEFDPDQPRIKTLSFLEYQRHYIGISKQEAKMKKLIEELLLEDRKFTTINEFLLTNDF